MQAFACKLLRLRLLLLHGVHRQLLNLATLQELLRAVATGVGGALRHEDHVQTRDVLGDGVLGGGLCTLRLDADLERTEAVQLTMCTTSTSIPTTVYW